MSTYEVLYARWLTHPGTLLDLAQYEPGMKLLDLCGGSGVISREAIARGTPPTSITLFDQDPCCPIRGVKQVRGQIEALTALRDSNFDVVVCRQAVACWAPETLHDAFEAIWYRLKPGGKFVFNTFIRPRWGLKIYRHQSHSYIEASGWFGSRVAQLQCCLGTGADLSFLHWHKEEVFWEALIKFEVQVVRNERGMQWLCTRPG